MAHAESLHSREAEGPRRLSSTRLTARADSLHSREADRKSRCLQCLSMSKLIRDWVSFGHTGMKRATNNCVWLLRSRQETCGKPCVGEYCKQHNYQLEKGGKLPTPCSVCGVGIFCDSGICIWCGGEALKKRPFRERIKVKESFARVLEELMRHTV